MSMKKSLIILNITKLIVLIAAIVVMLLAVRKGDWTQAIFWLMMVFALMGISLIKKNN